MKKWISVLAVFLSLFVTAQNESLFHKATTAYNDGNYQDAVKNYLQILDNGEHSANLYYNLGNSYYKLNQIGPSIYYYEKALLLNPKDTEIRNNLSFAQNMTIDAIEPVPQTSLSKAIKSFKEILSFDQWAYMAVGCMFLFVFFYLAFYFLRFAAQKRIAFIISLLTLFFMAVSIVMAIVQYQDFSTTQPAIIFTEESKVKAEPNNRSNEVFVLHEGSKVFVEDQLGDWNKIKLVDGKTGWIPASDLKMLKDF